MKTLYELDSFGYFSGARIESGDGDPIPSGWTDYPLPEVPIGMFARLTGNGWELVSTPPPVQPNTQPAMRPTLIVTSISVDAAHTASTEIQLREVTCHAGAVLRVMAQLRLGEQVLPISDVFRVPITSRDGREKVLLVTMQNGECDFYAPMRDSGVWMATEDGINESLPESMRMQFDGLTVYVAETV